MSDKNLLCAKEGCFRDRVEKTELMEDLQEQVEGHEMAPVYEACDKFCEKHAKEVLRDVLTGMEDAFGLDIEIDGAEW